MKIVFDVGGTSVKYGIADNHGNFDFMDSIPTPHGTLRDFLECVGEIFDKQEKEYVIDGAAFSFPGEVHSEAGVIKGISAVEFLHEHPLKDMLQQRFHGCPVTMANDANCAAWGELWKGVAQQLKDVVFVVCGTGIGGAVIENGILDKGVTLNRGEFGNFPMGGMREGVLLTWSDYTLEKQARKYTKQKGEKINGKILLTLAKQGDLTAAELMEEFYHWMAVGCIILEFSFDPELIAIGGGMSENKEIVDGIRDKVHDLLHGQRPGYLIPKIEACQRGNQANLYGALYYHLYGNQIERG